MITASTIDCGFQCYNTRMLKLRNGEQILLIFVRDIAMNRALQLKT